jgi:hypothetical protein
MTPSNFLPAFTKPLQMIDRENASGESADDPSTISGATPVPSHRATGQAQIRKKDVETYTTKLLFNLCNLRIEYWGQALP